MNNDNDMDQNLNQNLGQRLRIAERRAESFISKLLHWEQWEMISHVLFALLLLYAGYLLIVYPEKRSVTNLLLLVIALAIAVQIHQNINLQRGMMNTF